MSKDFIGEYNSNDEDPPNPPAKKQKKKAKIITPSTEFKEDFAIALNVCAYCTSLMPFASPRFFCNECFCCFCSMCFFALQAEYIANALCNAKCKKCSKLVVVDDGFLMASTFIYQVRLKQKPVNLVVYYL